MRKETRANLIFIVVLLALVLPGGVILFKKKSQPGERAIGSPDPVRTTTAWIDPYPAESVPRLAPIQALQWTGSLAMDKTPGPAVRVQNDVPVPLVGGEAERKTPGHVGEAKFYGANPSGSAAAQVMSEGRWFQVVSRGEVEGGKKFVRVVVWNEDTTPGKGEFSAEVGGTKAEVSGAHEVAMPAEVRHELQDSGYVMPPKVVTVLDVVFAGAGDVSKVGLTFVPSGRGSVKSEVAVVP